MQRTYLEREKARARKVLRPVYRFSLDRYECPFCVFRAKWEDTVYLHLKTCNQRH